MNVLCINAVTNQEFWRVPDELVTAMRARLPAGWKLVVERRLGELPSAVREARFVFGWPFPPAMIRGAPDLSWVHFFTAGMPESWRSVRITTTSSASAPSVAEHALFLALAALRGATR
jgi:phosphoglycerate dehydrogenase-like enzyme